jgi:methionyl-tRNA formyltransferase
MFIVSKSTGFVSLSTFFKTMENINLTVLILDDSADLRSYFGELKEFCNDNDLPFLVAKGKGCLDNAIDTFTPDTVFVCGWYWIIDETIINKVPNGVLGIHNSLLPKYRGHAPLVWSMLNGDEIVGASLFEINLGMDTGKIYHQWFVKTEKRYINDVITDIEFLIERDFGKVYNAVINGALLGKEQNHREASYSSMRREADGLIEWQNEARDIILKIKALSTPYPNAFMFIGDEKIILKKAEFFESKVYGEPGQVVFVCSTYAIICCGNKSAVKITQAVGSNMESKLERLFIKLSSPPKAFE